MFLATALLIVRVYDTVGIAPADLNAARMTTRAILNDAGIRVAWRSCQDPSDCREPLGPSELMVRVVTASPASTPQSLGFSFVEPAHRTGILATVFADRVVALARAADLSPGPLLGRTIAHELGHLLVGSTDHARRGLMRGRWTLGEVLSDAPEDWRFSVEDGRLMRWGLIGRVGIVAENKGPSLRFGDDLLRGGTMDTGATQN